MTMAWRKIADDLAVVLREVASGDEPGTLEEGVALLRRVEAALVAYDGMVFNVCSTSGA